MSMSRSAPGTAPRRTSVAGSPGAAGTGATKLTPPEPPDHADRQRAVTDADHNLLLQAGAGSGKTTTLIDRFGRLLSEAGADVTRVVAVTFTDKAAGELKERLRDLCDAEADRAGTGIERDHWRRHRRSVDTAHIGTIHGFCSRLLHVHALRVGIDPLFEVLDETQAELLLQDTMRELVLGGLREGSPALRELVASLGLDHLVGALAVAVSQRAKIVPGSLCASADDLLRRWNEAQAEEVRALLTQVRASPEVREAADVLRRIQPLDEADILADIRRQALEASEAALNEQTLPTQALPAWRRLADLPGVGNKGRKGNWPPEQLEHVRAAVAALTQAASQVRRVAPADEAVDPNAAALTAHFHAVLPRALQAYASTKRERSAVDFDDQLLLTRDLLRDHRDVREAEQRRFDHLLVDEFQDTDPVQREIIWYLAEDGASASCLGEVKLRPGKLFLVGDAKQSIYGFRGADVAVYAETRREFAAKQNAGCATLSLTANFRSQPRLVAFFNDLFSHPEVMGTEPTGRAPFEAHYEPLQATRAAPEAGVDVSFLLAADPDANLDELRERAADGIAAYVADGRGNVKVGKRGEGDEETWQPADWQDFMILLPTMTGVQIYERALRRRRVPYYVVSGKGFFARPEVMDVVALLEVLDEPRNEVALARLLRAPCCGVSDEGLYWLAREGGLAEGLRRLTGNVPAGSPVEKLAEGDCRRAHRAARMIAELRAARHHLPLADLVERVLDATALPSIVATRFDGARGYANLRKVVEIAREFEGRGPVLLSRFVEHVETLRAEEIREGEAPAEEEQGNTVTLMTIHKAKGLQRPIVIVADLWRQPRGGSSGPVVLHPTVGPVLKAENAAGKLTAPPIAGAVAEAEAARDMAERRRLLYVALTRARDRLVISAPLKLNKDGVPSGGGVWIDALFAAFGPALVTDGALAGHSEFGEWSGEVVQLGPTGEARSRLASASLLVRHASQIEACEPIPEGNEAEETQIVGRTLPVPPDLTAKARFTVTELADYLACPHRYRLRYVEGLAPYAPPTDAVAAGRLRPFERGNVVHRTLQRLGRGPVSETRAEVEAAMRECGLAGHEAREVDDILALLVRFTGSRTWEMVRTAAELRSEVPVVARLAPGLIEGYIDALVRDREGALHLIDYKTGRADDVGTLEEHQFQVGAYAAAIGQARGRLPATGAIHYLAANERVEVDPRSEAQSATGRAEAAMRGTQAGDFPRREHCDQQGCPYAWLCEGTG